jgi:hypothetical protein
MKVAIRPPSGIGLLCQKIEKNRWLLSTDVHGATVSLLGSKQKINARVVGGGWNGGS